MTKDDVRSQMELLVEEHKQLLSHCATIKRWCLTLWVGMLVARVTERLQVPPGALLGMQLFSVLAFWSLEAAYGATLVRRERQIRLAEQWLQSSSDPDPEADSSFLYPYSFDHQTTRAEKFTDLWEALRTVETMSYIYVLLFLCSLILFVSLS